ncbi:MAG: hypothetical protein LBM06_02770 [Prevotellaceae bacterium]|jgi:hypothetical protein|nr:hypothetical protein [Prevotellaceae bacterium]
MKKIVCITLCLLSLTTAVNAQKKGGIPITPDPLTPTESFAINGLAPGNTYTLAQMKAALGPLPYPINSWTTEYGTGYEIFYGKDMFHLQPDSRFTGFAIKSNKFPVFVCGVFLQVGDNISKIPNTPDIRLVLEEAGLYYLYIQNGTDPLRIRFDNNRIITALYYRESV